MSYASAFSPILREFVSSNQTLTTSGLLTIAHGLGVVPKFFEYFLVCLTAEAGYSVNDIIHVDMDSGTTVDRQFSNFPDATNINIRFGASATLFNIANKTTGAAVPITNANWALIIKAYA